MKVTTNPIVPEVAANNPYLQQELDLTQQIRDALENSAEVAEAIEALKKAKSTKQRTIEELEKFRENKTELETALSELKRNFGASDSFEDLKKMEEFELRLKAIDEAIPLLERKFEHNSVLTREIEDCTIYLTRAIDKALSDLGIKTQLQRDMDAKVNDILQTFSMYQSTFERVRTELLAISKEVRLWKSLRDILPKVEGLEHITGDFYKVAMAVAAGHRSGDQG